LRFAEQKAAWYFQRQTAVAERMHSDFGHCTPVRFRSGVCRAAAGERTRGKMDVKL
jgi:hypothetical protein